MRKEAVYTLQPTIANTNLRNCWYLYLCLSFHVVFVFAFVYDESGQFTRSTQVLETKPPSKFSQNLPPDGNKAMHSSDWCLFQSLKEMIPIAS